MKERILQFLKRENLSASDLAEAIGMQPSTISHILSGRNRPSYEFLEKFLFRFSHISAEWLMTGAGGMVRDEPVVQNEQAPVSQKKIPYRAADEIPGLPKSIRGSVRKIILLYEDGSFEEFSPRSDQGNE